MLGKGMLGKRDADGKGMLGKGMLGKRDAGEKGCWGKGMLLCQTRRKCTPKERPNGKNPHTPPNKDPTLYPQQGVLGFIMGGYTNEGNLMIVFTQNL